jgi:PKD repeat protein
VRVPADFAAKGAPEYSYAPSQQQKGATVGAINNSSAFHPVGRQAPLGGVIAASPFGAEGNTIFAPTKVENEQPSVGGFEYAGVGAIAAASGSLQGWTGGQNIAAPRTGGEPPYACVLNPAGEESFAPVAAGSGGKVFVLAVEFIEKDMRERWAEGSSYEGPAYPAVIEFGPGGGGCPQVAPGGVSAEVNGEPVGGRTVTTAEPITFSSYVNQADALKVDWDFGDGTSETPSTQFRCPQGLPAQFQEYVRLGLVRQCPSAHHAFAHGGALTVTETIHTDSLATPTLTQTTTVNVAVEARVPTAIATGPLEVALGRPATFDGSASFGPGGPNQIREYHWTFGDGTPETSTTSPTIQHLYAALGLYTVSLTVTDKGGATSAPDTLPNPVAVVQPLVATEEIASGAQSGAGAAPAGAAGGYVAANPGAKPIPDVRLTKASLTAGTGGTLVLTLYCPAEESNCAGQLTLSALIAGSARGGKKVKPKATTLASGSFALAGGTPKRVTVRLSRPARALLRRLRRLTASLTILAHDPAGAQHTTRLPVVISTPAKRRAR